MCFSDELPELLFILDFHDFISKSKLTVKSVKKCTLDKDKFRNENKRTF